MLPSTSAMVDDDDDDLLLFADEEVVADASAGGERWRVLVIDDEPEVHAITRLALADLEVDGRSIELLRASTGAAGREILRTTPDIALVLLDVVMESEHAGLELARWIREGLGNRLIRIVLRTGQPGTAPEHRVMLDYDINDYRSKTELTARRLMTTVLGGIRSYRDLCVIDSQKEGLQRVIDASATLFERTSFESFLRGLLLQIAALLRPRRSTMFIQTHGPLFGVTEGEPAILAGTGRFAEVQGQPAREQLSEEAWKDIRLAVKGQQGVHRGSYSVFGLCHRAHSCAAVFVETATPLTSWESHLLELFCHNATVALDNLRLHHRQLALLAAFERFIPKRLLDIAEIKDVTVAAVGDHTQRNVAVVFADLRSFTRLAEELSPSDTFTFVNAFFAAVVPAIHKHGGVVDKFMGDGLMALFPGEPDDAVRASLEMIEQVRRFADEHLTDLSGSEVVPRIGVGIHYGPIILGLVGAADRLDFTGISDCVNATARIERLTRAFDADLLISHAIYGRLSPDLQAECRPLGQMEIRGKNQAVVLYEVFAADLPAMRAAKAQTRDALVPVATAHREHRWQDALDLLSKIREEHPDDAPLRTVARHCRHQIRLERDGGPVSG